MPRFQIDYTDDTDDGRRAVADLVKWLGYRRSVTVFRYLRYYGQDHIPAEERNPKLNGLDFMLDVAGVSGEPVRQTFRRVLGQEKYESWMKS